MAVLRLPGFNNSNLALLPFLRGVQNRLTGPNKVKVAEMISLLKEGRGVFPYQHPVYQALTASVRRWTKKDVHCHVSHSLDARFIFDLFHAKPPREQGAIFAEPKANKWHAAFFKSRTWQELDTHLLAAKREDRFRGKASARDLPITTLADFKNAVKHVAKQVFADGVQYLDLRFCPIKSYASVEEVLQGVYEALLEAESPFGRTHRVMMILGFNRSRYNPQTVESIVDELVRIKQQSRGSDFSERILGIDIAGPKEAATPQYRAAFAKAKRGGLLCVTHIGHWGYTTSRGEFNPMEKHLDAVFNAVANVPELDRITHAMPAGPIPQGLLGARDREGGLYTPERVDALSRKLERLWEMIRQRGILIEACPSNNLKSHQIADYREHPFHFWLRQGFRVALGIDGLWYWPSTLSAEIVKLLMADPEGLKISALRDLVAPSAP